ncbi:GtrA family protein [Marinibacterium sp. SX1]|uniref:GtrA family protein n=1 Tax=Marinibacterium sp. SX1 TaxID=3388424 RepID=UPI003D16D761
MSRTAITLLYVAFAALSTVANLATQRLVLSVDDGPAGFAAAIFLGTLAGLVLKYVLDKRWIFDDRSTGMAENGRKFTLYTAMGIVTTAVFWGTETAFWLIWHTDMMREIGAVLGLAMGYAIKYRLDRKFVFTDARLAGQH